MRHTDVKDHHQTMSRLLTFEEGSVGGGRNEIHVSENIIVYLDAYGEKQILDYLSK